MSAATFWARIREDARKGKLTWGFGNTAIPGLFTIEALHPHCHSPLAVVQFRWIHEKQLDITWSYVRPSVKRCGVRTFLHNRLLDAYPAIDILTTCGGTRAGVAWMKATGYRLMRDGHWQYRRRKPKRSKR